MNHIENLKVLIAAVEDQPEELFDLARFRRQTTCGTIFCTAGLMTTVPHFQKLGMHFEEGSCSPVMDNGAERFDVFEAGNILFGYFESPPYAEGCYAEGREAFLYFFEIAGDGLWDDELDPGATLTDKELALARLRHALAIRESEL